MNVITMLLAGTAAGWLTQLIFRRKAGFLSNLIVGILGALLSGFVLTPLFGFGSITFSLSGLLISFIGALLPTFGIALLQRLTSSASKSPSPSKPTSSASNPSPSSKPSPHPSKPSPRSDYQEKVDAKHVFISYRRDDAADAAGRIYDRLAQRFGQETVFKDVDSIPLGANFQKHIVSMIDRCSIVLVVIGRHWLGTKNSSGQRRLDDPRDFVRIEIELALQRPAVTIVPLLLQGVSMPATEDLPLPLQDLAFRQATAIRSDPDFHRDMDRLIQRLESHFRPS